MKKVQSFIFATFLIFSLISCSQQEKVNSDEFSTPEKTYTAWIEAGAKGDLATSMSCLTTASRMMMDQQVQQREEFTRRMVSSSAIFKNFAIVDKKVSGDNAVIVIESPDKKGKVAVPLLREADGWKVDLVAMFGG